MPHFRYSAQDGLPAEADVIDKGLGEFNDQVAPLLEVQALSYIVRDELEMVVGGFLAGCPGIFNAWLRESWKFSRRPAVWIHFGCRHRKGLRS